MPAFEAALGTVRSPCKLCYDVVQLHEGMLLARPVMIWANCRPAMQQVLAMHAGERQIGKVQEEMTIVQVGFRAPVLMCCSA